MNNRIKQILTILEKNYGGTRTALKYQSPFQLLVATMLAAQSTDVQVNIVTKKLFAHLPTPEAMARLSAQELEPYIKTVGLYHTKARNIVAASKLIAEKYGGEIPTTREELMKLPGVGRKTANVVLSIVTDFPAIAVDTHVFRVSNRLGLAHAGNVLETEKQLMKNIPQEKWADAHHWLIWHGRKICKARKPLCEQCPLKDYCEYFQTNQK
ncbi:MAG TPA: endonuclease III [Caldithrix abyssi]|uniref:Endonuclease III n=1 Tax=Caldithrix abyssi TaxID=187145 RepID=A0A7V5PPN4_CALAY|nr:endonuclease III [Caldithrix abyssi]